MLLQSMLSVPLEAFPSYLRSYLDSTSERFFSIPYERPENNYKLPTETDREACDRIVSGTIIAVLEPWAFEGLGRIQWHSNPNGYMEWTWQVSRHPDLKLLAHEYRLTGNKAYAKAAETIITSWLDNCPPPPLSEDGNNTDCWRTIEAGIRMGANWPYFIYSFYKEFPDELLCRIVESLYVHAEQLVARSTTGNWKAMEMNGLMHIAVLNPYLSKAEEWKAHALSELLLEAERQFYPDGFQYELTTNYHEATLNNYQRTLELMKAFDIPVPEELYGILLKAAETDVLLMMPDGRLPDLNDGNPCPVKPLLVPKARYFSSPLMEFVLSDRKSAAPGFKSAALPYSGFFVFRSGWERDAVYGLLDSAPIGRLHQHEDKLCFIAANGEDRFLTEGGCYAYDHSPMHDYVLSSYAHNVLFVDGEGQNRRKSYKWREEDIKLRSDISYGTGESVEYASGTYSGPYGDDESHPAVWTRTVYFLKKLEGFSRPFFVIVDRIEAKDGKRHQYSLQWLTDSERISIGEHKAVYKGGAYSFQEGGMLSVVRGEKSPVRGFVSTGIAVGNYKSVDALSYGKEAENVRIVTLLSFEKDVPELSAPFSLNDETIAIEINGIRHSFTESMLKGMC